MRFKRFGESGDVPRASTRRFQLPPGGRHKGTGASSNDEHGGAHGRVDLIDLRAWQGRAVPQAPETSVKP
jgi:hypothetical protein